MNLFRKLFLAGAVLVATHGQAFAAEQFDPAAYLAGPCAQCHGTEVYTRPDRKVRSLEALKAQVRRCDSMLGTKLFDDDLDALVAYLNQHYYKF